MAQRVLLVEDDPAVRRLVGRFLERSGFEIEEADSAETGIAVFRERRPNAVLLDFALPDGSALDVLPRMKTADPDVPVIILTGHGSIERAVQSVKEGAEDFLTKPVELAELTRVLERALRSSSGRAGLDPSTIDPFLGSSAAVRELSREAHLAVRSDSPVLLRGETGSGKGVLARWIHSHGSRSDGPFVTLNCSGLSKELLESELFGHAKGAFTGAVRDKRGLLEAADGGVLFLDEIGDLDTDVQPKLLTVLEDKTFRRVGEIREQQVDLRLIAATNQELAEQTRDGDFRSDLYFRISTIVIHVPPLRERREDLPELIGVLARDLQRESIELSDKAMEELQSYRWPGNFRELRSVLERAVLAAGDGEVTREHLRFDTAFAANPTTSVASLAELERRHIEDALRNERGHVTRTAKRLGIPRSTFYEKLKALEIDPDDYR